MIYNIWLYQENIFIDDERSRVRVSRKTLLSKFRILLLEFFFLGGELEAFFFSNNYSFLHFNKLFLYFFALWHFMGYIFHLLVNLIDELFFIRTLFLLFLPLFFLFQPVSYNNKKEGIFLSLSLVNRSLSRAHCVTVRWV